MSGCPLFSFNATQKIFFSPVKFMYSCLSNNEHQTKKSLFSCAESSSPRKTVSFYTAAYRELMRFDHLHVRESKLSRPWACLTSIEFQVPLTRGCGGQTCARHWGGWEGEGVCLGLSWLHAPFHAHVWWNLGLCTNGSPYLRLRNKPFRATRH